MSSSADVAGFSGSSSRADGTFDKFKARVVAQGFSRKPGVDYDQTYAPVARMETIRLFFTLEGVFCLHMNQFDVVAAFLYGMMLQFLCMRAPEGLVIPEGYCLQIMRALYGLKQFHRIWNKRIDEELQSAGF